ncbi:DoxX family protein [bacterium]|nr:MAG: DoxX family protein [bacterium]
MKQLIASVYGPFQGGRVAFGLFLLRVIVGAAFAMHGYDKITNPFHWGDQMGLPPILQGLAALAEFGGGVALIFGFLTPLAAAGIAVTMAVAFLTVHLKYGNPWIASKPGANSYESVAFYFITAVTVFLTGPGKISIDALLFDRKNNS